MPDSPLVTAESVAAARDALLAAGKRVSQRAVIRELGGGSFSQVGPLLRALEADQAEPAGNTLTEPLQAAVTEAIEALWRTLGAEADAVVNTARGEFERQRRRATDAQAAAEATLERTQAALVQASCRIDVLEQALGAETRRVEEGRVALEQERLARVRVEVEREALNERLMEHQLWREESLTERAALHEQLDAAAEAQKTAEAAREQERQASAQSLETARVALTEAREALAAREATLAATERALENVEVIRDGLSEQAALLRQALARAEAQASRANEKAQASEAARLASEESGRTRLADRAQLVEQMQQELAGLRRAIEMGERDGDSGRQPR